MALPEPEPGLVISYSFLWSHERAAGEDSGRKDRPCVIVLAIERQQDGDTVVVVLPITHRPPEDTSAVIEIPQAIKRHLGLDMERSWIVLSEGNLFEWPGYYLRKIPERNEFHYGLLPPRFFDEVMKAYRAFRKHSKSP